jgi:DNA-binding XRE family transcriptional regulator
MSKIPYLYKHCNTSQNNQIALSNTLVERAIKIDQCPIKVTCDFYPGEVATYTVDDLMTKKVAQFGPYENKYKPGDTYTIFIYPWEGKEATEQEKKELYKLPSFDSLSGDSFEEPELKTLIEKREGKYVIRKPVVIKTTSYEEESFSLLEYVGKTIQKIRNERNLTQNALSNLTNHKVSTTSISQIETATTNPVLSSLEHICDALGLDITDLFPPKS